MSATNHSEHHMLLDLSLKNDESRGCPCHKEDLEEEKEKRKAQNKAIKKILLALAVAFIFMTAEAVGGYLANSLAVMTDALHMLTDMIGFLISLFAIFLGRRKPTKNMTFGWKRAEVLGALVSVLLIYFICGFLLYEATRRIQDLNSFELDPDVMLIVSALGVFLNVVMMAVLHQGGQSCPHEGGGSSRAKGSKSNGGGHGHGILLSNDKKKEISTCNGGEGKGKKKSVMRQNINVTAASIHVIGDLLQTTGVLITSYIVWFRRDWKIADPICTYIFGVLILGTTIRIMFEILRILMEGVPKGVSVKEVREKLLNINGVEMVHSLCVWSINAENIAVAAHLAISKNAGIDTEEVLKSAVTMLKEDYGVAFTSLQIEKFQQSMIHCKECTADRF